MQITRQRILERIKFTGAMNIDQLAEQLGVVPVTIRAHIGILEKESLIKGVEVRTGRAGRPSILYSLTDQGDGQFPKNYDMLTNEVLATVKRLYGEEVMLRVMRKIGEDWSVTYMDRIKGKSLHEQVYEAARILGEEGCLTEWTKEGEDYLITAHNCPYKHVAQENREICEMELNFLREVLDKPVELTNCVCDGDLNCTFAIKAAQ